MAFVRTGRNTLAVRLRAYVNDLSNVNVEEFTMTARSKEAEQFFGVNGRLRAGIATETEVGLPAERQILIPILPSMLDDVDKEFLFHIDRNSKETTYVSSRAGTQIVQIEGVHSNHDIAKRAKIFNDWDQSWQARKAYRETHNERFVEFKVITAKDPATRTEAEVNKHNAYIADEPVLLPPPLDFVLTKSKMPAESVKMYEDLTFLTYHLNKMQFDIDYPTHNNGARIALAHSIAASYNAGMIQGGSSREFVYVVVEPTGEDAYAVITVEEKYATRANKVVKSDDVLRLNDIKMSKRFLEIGTGLSVASGLNHYSFNHTTGGSVITGPVAVLAATNNLLDYQFIVNAGIAVGVETKPGGISLQKQTDLFYQALHPVNKRTVAAMAIPGSKVVTTYGSAVIPVPRIPDFDSFIRTRIGQPPAGTHKVSVGAKVLKRILKDGFGFMLPWYGEIKTVLEIIASFDVAGAEAHPGAMYYTGVYQKLSQTEVEPYMPELAYYAQKRMKNSTLVNSPHLAPEIANLASESWKAFVGKLETHAVATLTDDQFDELAAIMGITTTAVDVTNSLAVNAEVARQLDLVRAYNL